MEALDESKIECFIKSYRGLSPEQQEYLLRVLLELEQQKSKESIKWNRELVLEHLKKECTKKVSSEINHNEWTIVKLSFGKQVPTDFFVSDNSNINEILLSLYKKIMYSTKEIWSLLEAIKKYMKVFWVDIDLNINDYENVLKSRDKGKEGIKCEAWRILKDIAGLNKIYVLSNTDEDGNEIVFDCSNDNCCFRRQRKDGVFPSWLLCKVSEETK